METNNGISIFNFELNETTKLHLLGIAQWAKITAIVGFISVGISFLTSVILLTKLGTGASFGSGLLSWILSIMLNVILLGAAKSIGNGVLSTDQGNLNKGFADLAKYLRIIGILFIIVAAIIVLVLLVAVIVGVAGGFK